MAASAIWLPLESYEGITNSDLPISFNAFVFVVLAVGVLFFFIDGHLISGFLKKEVTIESNSFNTRVTIRFGDIFVQDGWKAIGVNDFFDGVVDDDLVSSNSLHGQTINRYWSNDSAAWQEKVERSLEGKDCKKTSRKKGNEYRYPIGTTAHAEVAGNRFLFFALAKTNKTTNVVQSSSDMLIVAIRAMLKHARVVCSNEPLSIPLVGSGLGRVGIKNVILVDLILAAIFEESQVSKVTESISIVLPEHMSSVINLGAIARDWS
ncbi:MAG: macro domain-containing protein [Pseudomonadota bacterium]